MNARVVDGFEMDRDSNKVPVEKWDLRAQFESIEFRDCGYSACDGSTDFYSII